MDRPSERFTDHPQHSGLGRELVSFFSLLTPRQKRDFWIVAVLETSTAMLGLVGLAAIVPLLAVLVDFESAIGFSRVDALYQWMGSPGPRATQVVLAAVALVLIWLAAITTSLAIFARRRFTRRLSYDLATRAFRRYLSEDLPRFEQRSRSEFLRNVGGLSERLSSALVGSSISVISRLALVIVVTGLLMAINAAVMAVILSAIAASYVGVYLVVKRRLGELADRNFTELKMLQQVLLGSYRTFASLKIDRRDKEFVEHYGGLKRAAARRVANFEIISALPKTFIEVVAVSMMIIAAFIIGRAVEDGGELVAVMGLFAIGAYRVLPSVQEIYRAITQITGALVQYRRVKAEWGDLRPHPEQSNKTRRLGHVPKTLELAKLSYRIEDRWLFRDLSLKFELQGLIRIAGRSGVGKSTLFELVAGLRPAHSGAIVIDGIPLEELNLYDWWGHISYLSQESHLFEGTVESNICFGKPRGDERERLAEVAAICGLTTDSADSELGIDSPVLEGGSNLSGGQQNRVFLARALFKASELVLLDEAFNALDVDSAREIISRMRAAWPGRCFLVISHRDAEIPDDAISVSLGQAVP